MGKMDPGFGPACCSQQLTRWELTYGDVEQPVVRVCSRAEVAITDPGCIHQDCPLPEPGLCPNDGVGDERTLRPVIDRQPPQIDGEPKRVVPRAAAKTECSMQVATADRDSDSSA